MRGPPFFNLSIMENGTNIFELEMFGEKNEVKLEYASYNCNGTLALQLFGKLAPDEMSMYGDTKNMDPYQSPYGIATVNLPESEALPINVQFVDENNLPGIGKWLQEKGIAKPLGLTAHSGYCCYQAYEFKVPENELKKIQSAREEIIGKQNNSEARNRHL